MAMVSVAFSVASTQVGTLSGDNDTYPLFFLSNRPDMNDELDNADNLYR